MGQIVGLCFRSIGQENLECLLGSSQVVRNSSSTWSSEAPAMRRKVFKELASRSLNQRRAGLFLRTSLGLTNSTDLVFIQPRSTKNMSETHLHGSCDLPG